MKILKKIKFIKPLIVLSIIIISIYILSNIVLNKLPIDHTKEYSINNKYKVLEKLTIKHNNYRYYFEITLPNKKMINFDYTASYKDIQLIKDILLYQDDNTICLYPVFNQKPFFTRVICLNDQYIYDPLAIKDQNIDPFIKKLESKNYITINSSKNIIKTNDNIEIYTNNFRANEYLTFWNNKDLKIIDQDNIKTINLSHNGQYENSLGVVINHFYITPDLNQNYDFTNIKVINLLNGKLASFKSPYKISFDSYVQGIINDEIYLIDRSNAVQYKINFTKKKVNIIGGKEKYTSYYDQGQFKKMNIYECLSQDQIFNMSQTIDPELKIKPFDRVDYINNYYYGYQIKNNVTYVYQIYNDNIDLKTLLFKTSDIRNVIYNNNNIYFIKDDTIYRYNQDSGLKPLIKHFELNFNKDQIYNIYNQ